MSKIAFIGLGTMGYPMAGHLAKAGHEVTVYNRTPQKTQNWLCEYPGNGANSPKEAASGVDIAITCVGNDDDLRSVVTGDQGIIRCLRPGGILIDHSTVSAQITRDLATQLKSKEIHMIDAPMSGGEPGAIKGQLTIMCGGEEAIYLSIAPILLHYAKATTYMGEAGAGQLTKMVNQICIAGLLQSLSEGLLFAEKAGLDPHRVINAISQGAAGSWQMTHRHQSMIADHYEHGFAVDWMRKDFGICLDEARRLGVSLPLAALVDQFYAEVQAMGGGRWDTSSLLARLKKLG